MAIVAWACPKCGAIWVVGTLKCHTCWHLRRERVEPPENKILTAPVGAGRSENDDGRHG